MNEKCKIFIDKLFELQQSYNEDNLMESLYELTDELEGVDGAEAVIPSILNFIETLSNIDLGSPGPLVHFIEKFYPNYDDVLLVSLERKPVFLTLWMCNRILNDKLDKQRREKFLSALRAVQKNSELDNDIKKEAENYLKIQLGGRS